MVTGKKVVAVAAKEIGVTENPANSNHVKYNTWYYGKEVSGSAYPWCMAFVQWCYWKAGFKLPYATASCSALRNWYAKNHPECIVSKPQAGDIVIYNFGHTGILEKAGNGTVTVIEGNTSSSNAGSQSNGGGVFRRTRKTSLVRAYIRPLAVKTEAKPEVKTESTKPVEPVKEDEKPMTGKEIYDALQDYTKTLPMPDWAKSELQEAVDMGITDGTNGMQLIPRYQAAIMSKRAVEKALKQAAE